MTAHLIFAIIIVQLLLYATYTAGAQGAQGAQGAHRAESASRATTAAGVLIALTLIQAGVGTQVRAVVDVALDAGVSRDAAVSTVGSLDYWHRDLAFVVVIGAALLAVWLLKRRSALSSWALAVLALAASQIVVGVVMAYVSLFPAAQVAHLSLASLLLGAETVLWLKSHREA